MDDYLAIANLVFRYAELADAGEEEARGELFTYGEFAGMHGPPYRGAEEAARNFRAHVRLYDDGLPWQKHPTTNLQIEVADDGQTASCRSVFMAWQEPPRTEALDVIGVGRYLDSFAKIDGEWHFARRQLVRDLTGNLAHAIPEEQKGGSADRPAT